MQIDSFVLDVVPFSLTYLLTYFTNDVTSKQNRHLINHQVAELSIVHLRVYKPTQSNTMSNSQHDF